MRRATCGIIVINIQTVTTQAHQLQREFFPTRCIYYFVGCLVLSCATLGMSTASLAHAEELLFDSSASSTEYTQNVLGGYQIWNSGGVSCNEVPDWTISRMLVTLKRAPTPVFGFTFGAQIVHGGGMGVYNGANTQIAQQTYSTTSTSFAEYEFTWSSPQNLRALCTARGAATPIAIGYIRSSGSGVSRTKTSIDSHSGNFHDAGGESPTFDFALKLFGPSPAIPTVTLTADPPQVDEGATSTLSWSTQNATTCTASQGWSGVKAMSGSEVVTISATTSYVLDCFGAGSAVSATTTIVALPSGCTVNCFSNVLFLPGIESSRLYRPDYAGGTNRLWEPGNEEDVRDLFLNEAGDSMRDDIYAKEGDVLDEIPISGSNIYKSFLLDLESWKSTEGVIADYGVVAYDWRLSLEDILGYGNIIDDRLYYSGVHRATSTPYILQELRRLAATSRSGKVTIVAHSNGGLVAKALLKQLEDLQDPLLEKIDTVILVAVPQTGTPQALGALLHGFDQALPGDMFPFILTPETARAFASTAPMVYHLLPSSSYITGDGGAVRTPVATFDEGELTQPFIDAYGRAIGNSTELHTFLQGSEGRVQPVFDDLNNPSIASPTLLSYGEAAHAALDAWTPPSEIQVHEIAGWGEETLASIRYSTGVECIRISATHTCLEYRPKLLYSPEMVIDGDGTVVVASALAMSTSSPNVKRWWVDLKAFNDDNFVNRDHTNILEVSELRGFVRNLFISDQYILPTYVGHSSPLVEAAPMLYFILHSPLKLSARDSVGNEISSSASSIVGATYKRFGEVQYISVPASAAPTLHLEGYTQGSFTLEIKEVIGNTIVASTTFAGIPTATSTVASMVFTDGTIEHASPLNIDITGDGVIDKALVPPLNSILIPDIAPPTTALILEGVAGDNGWYRSQVTARFEANDEGDVDATHVSLDGAATSTTTTLIIPEGIHTVRYFSVDLAGNEEALSTREVKVDTTSPEVRIHSSTTTRDIIVEGVDSLSTTTSTKTLTSVTISDDAGNTTKVNLQKTFTKGLLTYARIASIQYGTSTPMSLPSSFLYGWNTKISPPVLISQTIVVDKTFGIQAVYDNSKNKTTIVVLKKGIPIQKSTVLGLVVVKLTSNKGVVNYSW